MFGFLKSERKESDRKDEGGWASRLKQGLQRTREVLNTDVTELFARHPKIDEALYEELETLLISADVGVAATEHVIGALRNRAKRDRLADAGQLRTALKDVLHELIAPLEAPLEVSGEKPFVIMMVGVNGTGKTTSIGKLAKHCQMSGRSVLLAAGDTFRAAAREQLAVWGERNNVAVISQRGGDSAAVIFDAVQAARARGSDILIADTAGRLPTQLHLMDEIRKVKRVIDRAQPGAPHEILLVLDANTGQNALAQVKAFDEALGVTGLIMTKLDGTAKGGVIAAIAHTRSSQSKDKPIPLRFIGVGEGMDDLQPFDARAFVDALFD
ncbi:MAG: signal recognition particle-docking protein FtsY [Betaproteobacteria bacterium]|nr:signal recognition particle-docking protein FtsY [Betaproteobacteria bacterium]